MPVFPSLYGVGARRKKKLALISARFLWGLHVCIVASGQTLAAYDQDCTILAGSKLSILQLQLVFTAQISLSEIHPCLVCQEDVVGWFLGPFLLSRRRTHRRFPSRRSLPASPTRFLVRIAAGIASHSSCSRDQGRTYA
jgi:hypothetical protein